MSALMNVSPAAAVTPTTSLGLASGVSAAVWYPFHDAAGTTVTERLGKGGPNLTLAQAITTDWANYGCITPTGTQYATAAVGNTTLEEIFNLRDIEGQQLLVGWQQVYDGDQTGNEAVWCWGSLRSALGKPGGYYFNRTATETAGLIIRPEQGAQISISLPSSSITGITGLVTLVLSITGLSAATIGATLYTWDHTGGAGLTGTASPVDILSDGLAVPGIDPDFALTLLANITGTSADRIQNSTASNIKMKNWWAARRTSYDAGVALTCQDQMIAVPNTFPTVLLA